MLAALGKDGQILTVIPSKNEVRIRMGNAPEGGSQLVANVLFEDISKTIEEARCTSSTGTELSPKPAFSLKTNSEHNKLQLENAENLASIEILDANGRRLISQRNNLDSSVDVSTLAQGTYSFLGWLPDGQGSAVSFMKL